MYKIKFNSFKIILFGYVNIGGDKHRIINDEGKYIRVVRDARVFIKNLEYFQGAQ